MVELISHEAFYLHIWKDKKIGIDLFTRFRRQGKKNNKRRNGKSTRGQTKNRVCIEQRPQVVDDESRMGDWR